MSLDNIYTKTVNARDNLINAIRTMGVSVADNSTINQCANAILMIPSGGGEDDPEKEMPTDGLVLHYNMNDVGDTVTDTVNNIVLTSNGTEIFSGATGVNGTCWGTSGGTSSYLAGTYPSTLPSVFSMNLYIKYNGTAADSNVAIVEFGNNTAGTGYGLWVDTSGQLSWRINGNYDHYTSTNLTLPALKFVMITFTYDGANVCIYQNGILHRTESCTDIPSTSSSFGFFSRLAGGDRYGSNGSFVGVVDEFRFYDRVLTQEEIALLTSEFTGPGSDDGKTKFYKCASVDTVTKTWTGYELILSNGYYTISTTLTSGLTYTTITPVVGTVYTEDALVKVASYAQKIPVDGLVLYASLAEDSSTAETGQTITKNGSPTYQTIGGIPCIYVNQYGNSLTIEATDVPEGSSPTTWSFWVKEVNGRLISMEDTGAINGVNYVEGMEFLVDGNPYTGGIYSSSATTRVVVNETLNSQWHHIVMTRDGSNVYSMYCDGVLKAQNTIDVERTNGGTLALGYLTHYSDWGASGYVAALRIYDRALTQDEITALANEF